MTWFGKAVDGLLSTENYRHVYTTRCDLLIKNGTVFYVPIEHEAFG